MTAKHSSPFTMPKAFNVGLNFAEKEKKFSSLTVDLDNFGSFERSPEEL